jgi:predicted transcriptional regulator of viral defense system
VELAKRVPQGVLCLSSALRYHELTTENPSEIWLAIERGAWTPKIDFPPVRIAHFSEPAFDFGIEIHPFNGVQLRVYSPAKTVADCFKFRSKIGTETAIQALRATYREKRATMDELWKAAKVCRVGNIIRPYMESLT